MMNVGEGGEEALKPQYIEVSGSPVPSIAASNHTAVEMPARNKDQDRSPDIHSDSSWDTKISIAVDPVALITTECITVTSAMRKHARWAHSSVSAILGGGSAIPNDKDSSRALRVSDRSSAAEYKQSRRTVNGATGEDDTLASRWGLRGKKGKSMQDNPLLSAFARLRNDLRGCTGQDPGIPVP